MNEQQREAEIHRRLALPYHRVIYGDPVDGYVAQVAERPGCYSRGDTPAEALASLDEAIAAWLASNLLSGDPIPELALALAPVA